jgi:hypothetical protein
MVGGSYADLPVVSSGASPTTSRLEPAIGFEADHFLTLIAFPAGQER